MSQSASCILRNSQNERLQKSYPTDFGGKPCSNVRLAPVPGVSTFFQYGFKQATQPVETGAALGWLRAAFTRRLSTSSQPFYGWLAKSPNSRNSLLQRASGSDSTPNPFICHHSLRGSSLKESPLRTGLKLVTVPPSPNPPYKRRAL